jgi:hypothetical protein
LVYEHVCDHLHEQRGSLQRENQGSRSECVFSRIYGRKR